MGITGTPGKYGEIVTFVWSGPCDTTFRTEIEAHKWCKENHDLDAVFLKTSTAESLGYLSCSNQAWEIERRPTEPPQCQNVCYADNQPWRKKCGWEMGGDPALEEKCKKCPECPLGPVNCQDGPFTPADQVTFQGKTGAFWFTDYCGRTHAPTAAPTTNPNCQSWCANSPVSWTTKCSWQKNCNECKECPTPAPTPTEPPQCQNVCYADNQPWRKKCGWEMGGDPALKEKCKKCPECPLGPVNCQDGPFTPADQVTFQGQTGEFWFHDYCGRTHTPTAAPTTLAPPTATP